MIENSPAFQRRVDRPSGTSPEGTAELQLRMASQPSLRDLTTRCRVPGVETPGYCRLSLRDANAPDPRVGLKTRARLFQRRERDLDCRNPLVPAECRYVLRQFLLPLRLQHQGTSPLDHARSARE